MRMTPEELAAHMKEHNRLWAEEARAKAAFLALGRETHAERKAKGLAMLRWNRANWEACEHSLLQNPWQEEPPTLEEALKNSPKNAG